MYEFRSGECTFEYRPPDGSPGAKKIAEEILGRQCDEEIEAHWDRGDDA
jgi:hypothetical protein